MKILVVNWRDIFNPEAGGAEIHIDEILKRKPDVWEVDFVSAEFKGSTERDTVNGYHIHRIPNNSLFHVTFKKYWRKHLKKNDYDLIIDDVSKIPLCIHRYVKDIPVLAVHHHIHGKSLFKQLIFPIALYVYTLEKHFLKFYKNVPMIVVSDSDYKELIATYDYQNARILHNGVDLAPLRNIDVPKTDQPSVIYLGRLKKYKRVNHVLSAFKLILEKYPDAHLFIGGKGDDEPRLKKITAELGLESKVDFLGFVTDEIKYKFLKSSWLMGIASEKEGWGIVVIEANAVGTPVVGYDVEGLRDSIKDGVTGFLTENGNIEQFAQNMLRLIDDRELRNQFGEQAVKWSSQFDWDHTAKQFYQYAEQVVKDFRTDGETS